METLTAALYDGHMEEQRLGDALQLVKPLPMQWRQWWW